MVGNAKKYHGILFLKCVKTMVELELGLGHWLGLGLCHWLGLGPGSLARVRAWVIG